MTDKGCCKSIFSYAEVDLSALFSRHLAKNLLLISSSFFVSAQCFAQSTPAEFAEMSLEDLFSISTEESAEKQSPLSWTLQYRHAEFDGYLQGDSSLTLDEVLFVPGTEDRTDSNFPVVPTVITQEVTFIGSELRMV